MLIARFHLTLSCDPSQVVIAWWSSQHQVKLGGWFSDECKLYVIRNWKFISRSLGDFSPRLNLLCTVKFIARAWGIPKRQMPTGPCLLGLVAYVSWFVRAPHRYKTTLFHILSWCRIITIFDWRRCRIHRIHSCRGVRPPPTNECPDYITLDYLSPVGSGCRIHQLYLCREVKPFTPMSVLIWHETISCFLYCLGVESNLFSAGNAVDYTNCTSAEGQDPLQRVSWI